MEHPKDSGGSGLERADGLEAHDMTDRRTPAPSSPTFADLVRAMDAQIAKPASPVTVIGNDHLRALLACIREQQAALSLYVAWCDAEEDHSKTKFYERMEMCRVSEDTARAVLHKYALPEAKGGER